LLWFMTPTIAALSMLGVGFAAVRLGIFGKTKVPVGDADTDLQITYHPIYNRATWKHCGTHPRIVDSICPIEFSYLVRDKN
jgi:hypothetical protein